MRSRFRLLCAALAAASCGQPAIGGDAPEPASTQIATLPSLPASWVICDATNQPLILAFDNAPSAGASRLLQIDKTVGAATFDGRIAYGNPDGAAGSIYTPIMVEGSEAGFVRNINPGMLETPGSAYTLPVTSVKFRNAEADCRWLPRTRFIGVTDKRSLVVHEDADGDLVYTTFDFSDGASRTPIELSENGRSTTFSAEIRGGEEYVAPGQTLFSFRAPGAYEYRVLVDSQGPRIEVWRDGAIALSEPFIAYQLGQAQ
jgi:hypothetical protein